MTTDMCFPGGGGNITRDTCFLGGGTHITRDICFSGGEHISVGKCVFQVGNTYDYGYVFPRWGRKYH